MKKLLLVPFLFVSLLVASCAANISSPEIKTTSIETTEVKGTLKRNQMLIVYFNGKDISFALESGFGAQYTFESVEYTYNSYLGNATIETEDRVYSWYGNAYLSIYTYKNMIE